MDKRSPLLDHHGRPWQDEGEAPLARLAKMGVVMGEDGSFTVSKETLQRVREERARRATMARFPSTPRMLPREAGGLAVRKGVGQFASLSLESLRRIRENSPIIQAIHRARLYQVARVARRWSGREGDVGWRVVHRDHNDPRKDAPEYIKPFIRRFEAILEHPAPTYETPTTGAFLCPLWDDLATINRPSVEILRSAWDPNRIVGFRAVDGALVWPTLAWVEKWARENQGWWGTRNPHLLTEEEALNIVSEIMGHDLNGADYCLVREGVVEAVYDRNTLLVAPWVSRTDVRYAGFPPSHVEDAIEIMLSFQNTFDYNSTFFTRGFFAEFILGISGDIHDDDIDAFVDMLREASIGVHRAHQPPVMPLPVDGTIQKIDLKENNREMMFEVWMSLLIALACACYRMDPTEVNAKPWEGGGGPQLSGANREKEITLAKEQGLQGDLGWLCDSILTPLAQRCHPDLVVVMEWGDRDLAQIADIHQKESAVSRTRNEIRRERGELPWGVCLTPEEYEKADDEKKKAHDENPWNWPTDSAFSQAKQMQAMNAQQQQQAMMGQGQGGDDGGDDWDQPPDDGFGAPADGQDDGFGGKPPSFPYGQPPKEPGNGQAPGGAPSQPSPPRPPMTKGRRVTVFVHDSRRKP